MENLITEALQIAADNWDFDGEYEKANIARMMLKYMPKENA